MAKGYSLKHYFDYKKPFTSGHTQVHLSTPIHCRVSHLWDITIGYQDSILERLSLYQHLHDVSIHFHSKGVNVYKKA